MHIRTGRGDRGITDLSYHRRVSKDSDEICALGDMDELASFLGLVKARIRSRKEKNFIEDVQRQLHIISAEIVIDAEKKKKMGALFDEKNAALLIKTCYDLEKIIKTKGHFHLPGEGELSALLDTSRAIARRAERSLVRLFRRKKLKDTHILAYMNCLSDILFIMARKKRKSK